MGKNLALWIGGIVIAGLIAIGFASAKKPPEGIEASIEYTKVEKI